MKRCLCLSIVLFFFVTPAFALDADGDGYSAGGPRLRFRDCNDSDASIHPGADEYCDGADNNCNGRVDEPMSLDAAFWYQDSDGDGYGNSSSRRRVCSAPTGYVADNTDCNDSDAAINPGVNEAVDGVESDGADNNCDGSVDEIELSGRSITISTPATFYDHISVGPGGTLTFTSSTPLSFETNSISVSMAYMVFTAPSVDLQVNDVVSLVYSSLTISDATCSGVGAGSGGTGSYDGGGGGGASHAVVGGAGGNGGWTGGAGGAGSVYGSADDFVSEAGSCGGNGGGPSGGSGGSGGGTISITTDDFRISYGSLLASGGDGNNGSYDDGGGGGGSGGSIVLNTNSMSLGSAYLYVEGGNGGNGGSYSSPAGGGGGGGGAGGTVEITYADTLDCVDSSSGATTTYSATDYASAFSCLTGNGYINFGGGVGGSGGCGTSTCGAIGSNGSDGAMNSSLSSSGGTTSHYSSTDDFSAAANPNGVWSAGWATSPTGTLNIYPDSVVSGCGFSDWTDSSIEIAGTPSFAKNTSASTCTGIPPGFVTLHPGCNADEYSVLRWTAPLDATCDVSISLYSGDAGETDASILHNGVLLDYFSVTSTSPIYADTLTVSFGDTLDLAVGDLGACTADSTPFDFVVDCR